MVGAVAALVLLAGCGSDDDGDASGPPPTEADGAAAVSTHESEGTTYLVDGDGRALYLWVADTGSESTCSGACAGAWPPLLTEGDPKAEDDAEQGALGTAARADGGTQVTYDGHPLYYYVEDEGESVAGQGSDGFGAKWWLVDPSGDAITTDVGGGTDPGGGGY